MIWAALAVSVLTASAREDSGAAERYDELVTSWEKNERGKPRPDLAAYASRFLELAKGSPSEPAARDALLWIIGQNWFYAPSGPLAEINDEAMELLVEHHADDPIAGAAGMRVINMPTPGRERFLRRLAGRSRDREAKGRALLALAEYLKMKSRIARGKPMTAEQIEKSNFPSDPFFLDIIASDPGPVRQEAERLFEKVSADFADVLFVGGGRPEQIERYKKKGIMLGTMAEQSLFELRSLQVGQPAPETVGEDTEGKTFRLSDYRGKVVVLTFSGNWCGPCVRMYPAERRLTERLRDRPFALLSVNTDEKVETLREAIEKGEITWRCWWDGEPGGPITSRWNIQGYPTVFVIDHKGIIRYNQMDEETLEEAVEKLLSELK